MLHPIAISPTLRHAFTFLKEGKQTEGMLALYQAWIRGNSWARRIFRKITDGSPTLIYQRMSDQHITNLEQGSSDDKFALGLSYFAGLGVAYNPDEAKRIFSELAEQDHHGAQHALGAMHHWINYGTRIRDAQMLLMKAAEHNGAAAAHLGEIYNSGFKDSDIVFPNDEEVTLEARRAKAEALYHKARSLGCTDVCLVLGAKYLDDSRNPVSAEAFLEAEALYTEAMKAEEAGATAALAKLYSKAGTEKTSVALVMHSRAILFGYAIDTKWLAEFIDETLGPQPLTAPSTRLREYLLARIAACRDGEMERFCRAIESFRLPSEYADFFEEDFSRLYDNQGYMLAVGNMLFSFLEQEAELNPREQEILNSMVKTLNSQNMVFDEIIKRASHYLRVPLITTANYKSPEEEKQRRLSALEPFFQTMIQCHFPLDRLLISTQDEELKKSFLDLGLAYAGYLAAYKDIRVCFAKTAEAIVRSEAPGWESFHMTMIKNADIANIQPILRAILSKYSPNSITLMGGHNAASAPKLNPLMNSIQEIINTPSEDEVAIYNRITDLHAQLNKSQDTPLARELSTLLETYGFSSIFLEEPGARLSASKR